MAVIEQRNTVRIPQNQSSAIHRLHRLRDELEQKTAHNVRFEVAAEASDMKLDVATDVMRIERTHSLDSPLPNMELTLGDTIPSPDAPTYSTFAEGRLQDLLNGAEIPTYAATLAEIGAAEGISRERVRQIIEHALASCVGRRHNYVSFSRVM